MSMQGDLFSGWNYDRLPSEAEARSVLAEAGLDLDVIAAVAAHRSGAVAPSGTDVLRVAELLQFALVDLEVLAAYVAMLRRLTPPNSGGIWVKAAELSIVWEAVLANRFSELSPETLFALASDAELLLDLQQCVEERLVSTDAWDDVLEKKGAMMLGADPVPSSPPALLRVMAAAKDAAVRLMEELRNLKGPQAKLLDAGALTLNFFLMPSLARGPSGPATRVFEGELLLPPSVAADWAGPDQRSVKFKAEVTEVQTQQFSLQLTLAPAPRFKSFHLHLICESLTDPLTLPLAARQADEPYYFGDATLGFLNAADVEIFSHAPSPLFSLA